MIPAGGDESSIARSVLGVPTDRVTCVASSTRTAYGPPPKRIDAPRDPVVGLKSRRNELATTSAVTGVPSAHTASVLSSTVIPPGTVTQDLARYGTNVPFG